MIEKLSLKLFNKDFVSKASDEPGVYIFFDKDKNPIYVGKAINLRRRLTSYTLKNLETKTSFMVSNAGFCTTIQVSSEIEALLLEARLVQKFKPKYNIQLKDDKSPLYIVITKEEYPRVLTMRRTSLKEGDKFFGPFLSSTNVKFVLKIIRRIFPFATHKPDKRACFYSHIGLCNPCPSVIEKYSGEELERLKKKYLKNIRSIKRFLRGDVNFLISDLTREMKRESDKNEFEKARALQRKIESINYITRPPVSGERFIDNPNLKEDLRDSEVVSLKQSIRSHFLRTGELNRIECFDIAHLTGKYPVASMVTFTGGDPDKAFYRHFKILQTKSQSDVDSMNEVALRRLKHIADWGKPDLIVVDGGKGQVTKMQRVFETANIAVVGIAKLSGSLVVPIGKEGEKYNFQVIPITKKGFENLLIRLKDEAHRFSRRLHHKLLKKSYGFD